MAARQQLERQRRHVHRARIPQIVDTRCPRRWHGARTKRSSPVIANIASRLAAPPGTTAPSMVRTLRCASHGPPPGSLRNPALRGVVWVMRGHVESCREPRHDVRHAHRGVSPWKVGSACDCLEAQASRVAAVSCCRSCVACAVCRSPPMPHNRERRASSERRPQRSSDRPASVPRAYWRKCATRPWRPAGVDTFVPRALDYGTGERCQRTAVSRGLAAVVVCGT